jgi:hypothetical protein
MLTSCLDFVFTCVQHCTARVCHALPSTLAVDCDVVVDRDVDPTLPPSGVTLSRVCVHPGLKLPSGSDRACIAIETVVATEHERAYVLCACSVISFWCIFSIDCMAQKASPLSTCKAYQRVHVTVLLLLHTACSAARPTLLT